MLGGGMGCDMGSGEVALVKASGVDWGWQRCLSGTKFLNLADPDASVTLDAS